MRVRSVALFASILLLPVWQGSGNPPPSAPTVDDLRAGVPDRIAAFDAADTETLRVPGLEAGVEILKDLWGVSHIYAETEHDLFFAQGYSAARDRLFQFELWRRQATGTVSEILGPRELERDRGARLFRFRGDLEAELNHYHPRGAEIIRAFTDGINAYIAETERDPDLLPVEFEMLGIRPQPWTPDVVISRHQGLLMNIGQELDLGIAVAAVGAEKVKEVSYFHPGEPDIDLDPAVDGSLLRREILDVYRAFRGPVRFQPEDIDPRFRATASDAEAFALRTLREEAEAEAYEAERLEAERMGTGSNNWVVAGSRTLSGHAIMANDPHRVQAAPSLRYLVHLVGPGWNVIGGGEPVLPGISIGHNGYGAWGLTVFQTDAEDLYVYRTHPEDPDRYLYRGDWEAMRVIDDEIPVEGRGPERVRHKYTRHGPVVYEDRGNGLAYAVRAGWMEIGGAPYLASLRMNQAKTWEEFRDACNYSNIPGENMVWADVDGNIGWQSVGIAPIRRNWSGLVPVPGDGRYEWDGYLEIVHKPHVFNPDKGFWSTANQNLVPPGYEHRDAVGWSWSDPFRSARIDEVLATGRRFTMAEMMQLATDYVSLPARSLVPMLRGVDLPAAAEAARGELLDWDFALAPESREAAIYVSWEREIQRQMVPLVVPAEVRASLGRLSMKKIIDWLGSPPAWFAALGDGDPVAGRDVFLARTLADALEGLEDRFGGDPWRYGDVRFKHARFRHPLSGIVNADMRARLEVGPLPRGGNGFTVNQTGGGDNQTSGPSFRIIAEAGDWDTAVFTNTPGQGGDPDDPMYRNLFEGWAKDRFFPLYYSRERVEAAVADRLMLTPN
ncbi:penicillin acylase family protein [Candidatus Palauibacter soopunensis]|uniref:penicillin acylase family protein n=1 Tax=Candidatus Palauibacter soopunensis TaxID=3056739 RepID=UPI0023A3491D|nr:penicillin acylase family protein [Candidatus Palauibacter soopunensis]MDE2879859.1 penicillin acylase family protein [Candidatus Palauibacter soopunensis]